MGLYKKHDALVYFLGRVPDDINNTGTIKYSWFYKKFKEDRHTYTTKRDFEQVTWAFLLYLFGATLFPTRDSRVHYATCITLRRGKTCPLLKITIGEELRSLRFTVTWELLLGARTRVWGDTGGFGSCGATNSWECLSLKMNIRTQWLFLGGLNG